MKITILNIRNVTANVFEVFLNIDGANHNGTLTRDVKAPVWHPSVEFSRCLQNTGHAAKHVAKAVGDFSRGQQLCFPIDLGEF